MKKIVCFSAIVAVFVVGLAPTAQAAGSKRAEITARVPMSVTDESAILAGLDAALGTDANDVKALQTECGIPNPSGDKNGDLTRTCLKNIARALADQRAAFAASQRAIRQEIASARDSHSRVSFTVLPEVLAAANAACEEFPGTQARFSAASIFDCANPAFRVKGAGGSCTTRAGITRCTLEIKPLGVEYGRGDITPIPPPPSLPPPEKPRGWCGGSTLCRVAVVTAAASVAVGVGLYVGHVIKDGDWSPITVLR